MDLLSEGERVQAVHSRELFGEEGIDGEEAREVTFIGLKEGRKTRVGEVVPHDLDLCLCDCNAIELDLG